MANALVVRPAEPRDADTLSGRLAGSLEVLVACSGSGAPVGCIGLSVRVHGVGGAGGRVACVDGMFVDRGSQSLGVEAALLAAAEEWGRVRRCVELVSEEPAGFRKSI